MAGETLFETEFGTMAGEDEDADVIVSLPGAVEGEAKITKVAPGTVHKGADDPVDDLKSQFAAMTQRATTAEQRAATATQTAADATQRLQQAESRVVTSQLDTVLSGLAAAEATAKAAENEYIAAGEAGDFAAQARAQRKIGAAEASIHRLKEAKDDLEEMAKRPPAERTQQRTAAPAAGDAIEQFTRNMTPRSAAWIRANPDCVTDDKKRARMLAAHNLALADDVEVDSDEYFRRIDAGVKSTRAAPVDPKPAGDGTRPSSAAGPAAGSSGGLQGGTEVRLTKGEALSATDGTLVWNYDDPSSQKRFKKGDPIGLAEMARRKMEGKKAGLYDKSYSE